MLFYLSLGTFAFLAGFGLQLLRYRRHRHRLQDQPPSDDPSKVSVVIAARNEERNLEEALTSVLRQDCRDLEVIVVDDRSTDATGRILERLAAADRRLQVQRVDALPPGWLGKNHALWLAAARATGEWLLFTDADVVMAPLTLKRAVGLAQRQNLDHLAVGPEVRMSGWVLNAFAGAFMIFFALYARPWRVRDPASAAHIGIGAFNLVRSEVYRAVGGHRAIAMRPDDDMKLGKLIKKAGYRQDIAGGAGLMRVEWYASVGELIRGLEKNTYAGVDYNPLLLVAGTFGVLLLFVWPPLALLLTGGTTWLLNLGNLVLLGAIYLDHAAAYGLKFRYGLALPLAALLFVFILWRSAVTIHRNDGIDWRGTHYPLSDLKKNRV